MATVGRVGRPSGRRNSTALHGRVVGRRRLSEPVSGNHFRQVCQTPFGGILATKTSRPLAYWGGESAFSTATMSSRLNVELTYVVRRSPRDRNQRVLIWPRRTSSSLRTSKMSAKSESIAISIVRRTGRRA